MSAYCAWLSDRHIGAKIYVYRFSDFRLLELGYFQHTLACFECLLEAKMTLNLKT